jgi:hypothetical protein
LLQRKATSARDAIVPVSPAPQLKVGRRKATTREADMADLKIRVFKGITDEPSTTVTIPAKVLKIASSLIPKRAVAALQDEGIDLDEIVRLSENHEAHGKLVEIDGHERHERVVVSLE